MSSTLTVLRETNLSGETRGMSYSEMLDILAVTCEEKILLMKNMKPYDIIQTQHDCPTLASFNSGTRTTAATPPSHILVADDEGPIDVFDLQRKYLLRSYLEHGSRVTGLTWYDSESFISSSADGTVRLYKLTDHHSHHTINLFAGACGACINPFSPQLLAFGSTKGKFYVYDIRNTSVPFIEAKGHLKTVSNAIFVSEFELLTVGTDSTAKLWDLHRTVCTRNYEDNVHQKCFVGLDSLENFIAIGSEDSSVRVFKKQSSQSIASKNFHSPTSFISGCVLMSSADTLQLIVTGNKGLLMHLQLDIIDSVTV